MGAGLAQLKGQRFSPATYALATREVSIMARVTGLKSPTSTGVENGPIRLSRILLLYSILSCSVLSAPLTAEIASTAHQATYKSYEEVAASGLMLRVLNGVIARGGKS